MSAAIALLPSRIWFGSLPNCLLIFLTALIACMLMSEQHNINQHTYAAWAQSVAERAHDEQVAATTSPSTTIAPTPAIAWGSFWARPTPANTISIQHVEQIFSQLNYQLSAVKAGASVPAVMVKDMPVDLADIHSHKRRKELFIQMMLPLVLQVNAEIASDHQRIQSLHAQIEQGQTLSSSDIEWLEKVADTYRVEGLDTALLLQRVQPVPASIAIAQAAIESGWGTSRFAQEGNALFGQWTWDDDQGLDPLDREQGLSHQIKAFADPLESVRGYMLNLNRHRAYRAFRDQRTAWQKGRITSYQLADTLVHYSQLKVKYTKKLRRVMSANALVKLDQAQLNDRPARLAMNVSGVVATP